LGSLASFPYWFTYWFALVVRYLILLLTLSSCATLSEMGGAALGGALGGSVAGPGGAALGGALGVGGVKILEAEDIVPTPKPEVIDTKPPVADVIDSISNLALTAIYVALAFLVLIPFLTGKGRRFAGEGLRKILGNSAPKKWVDENFNRLNKHEEIINNLKNQIEDIPLVKNRS
jgi:hypothetical protein